MNQHQFFVIIAVLVGGFLGWIITKLKFEKEGSTLNERTRSLVSEKEEKDKVINRIQEDLVLLRKEKEDLIIDLTKKVSELDNLEILNKNRDKEYLEQQNQLRKDFELMANSILEKNSEKITLQNKENLKIILNPLQEKIKTFEKKVEDTHKDNIRQSSALKQQLEELSKNNLTVKYLN